MSEAIWDNFIDSDIDDSDTDADDGESEWLQPQPKRVRVGKTVLTVEEEALIEDDSDEEDFHGFHIEESNVAVHQSSLDHQWSWTAKDEIKWSRHVFEGKSFEFEQVNGDDPVEDYFSPLTYFMRYVPDRLFEDMATYTNLYAEQQHTKKWKATHKSELKQFIGLHVMMGNLKLPRIEMYYGKELQCKMFVDTIPLYRFYLLRTNLHFIDVQTISEDCIDKFIRVRPLMDAVRKRCLELPIEEYLSVDEQMIPLRGRITKGVKQFVKNKPKIRWGVKNVVLCGKSGQAYDFVCYQGSTTEFNLKTLTTFGLGATMVLHLADRIDKPGHKLFFDNYFSTFPLFEILGQKEIHAAGTVRLDRFSKPPFSTDNEMKKKGRGCSEEVVSSNGSVVCVKWYDNKCVALASNYIGIGTSDTAYRYDKTLQRKITIERPQIVGDYNINMGGVDLMNQMISYYRIFIRSRKWTLRMITHFIDFAIVQSWIEYKKDCQKSEIPKRQRMDLLAFRMRLAEQLVYFQTTAKRTARLSLDEIRSKHLRVDKSRERCTEKDIRYDGYHHLPKNTDNRLRCKLESCSLKSYVICTKCNVHLCSNKNNDCFYDYHMEP